MNLALELLDEGCPTIFPPFPLFLSVLFLCLFLCPFPVLFLFTTKFPLFRKIFILLLQIRISPVGPIAERNGDVIGKVIQCRDINNSGRSPAKLGHFPSRHWFERYFSLAAKTAGKGAALPPAAEFLKAPEWLLQ